MTLEIHKDAFVSPHADIEASLRGTLIKIGSGSYIDSFVKFKPAGGNGDLILGKKVYVNSGCVFYTGNGISIGDNVAIAANCTFAPVNHRYSDLSKPIIEQGFLPSKGGIVIEDNVWIGAGVVLLDGAVLRSGCVVAAQSVVRGEFPPNSIIGGIPAKVLGSRE